MNSYTYKATGNVTFLISMLTSLRRCANSPSLAPLSRRHFHRHRTDIGRQRDAPFSPTTTPALCPGTYLGHTVLITGGGTGLGRGMAKLYARLGADVLIVGRTLDTLTKTATEINTKMDLLDQASDLPMGHVRAETLNVRDGRAVEALSHRMAQDGTLPTVIVNNAAGNFACATEYLSTNAWRSVLSTVLDGTINVTTEFGKRMIARNAEKSAAAESRDARGGGGAVFLNISATYATTGTAFAAPSAAAKAGCDNLLRSLTAEWGCHRMRFVGIAPGPVLTEGASSQMDPEGRHHAVLVRANPSQRLGTVEEIANLATFLTSPYASWINGEIVRIDGGELCANSGEFNWLLHEMADAPAGKKCNNKNERLAN